MNELQIFNSTEFGEIRIIIKDGESMFCLIDICKALELTNSRVVADRLDEDERCKFNLPRQGETWFITESGLYAVILRSDKPNAKLFRKWVTSEVLPSIRKHGEFTNSKKQIDIEKGIAVVKFIADDLKVAESSRLFMYENYCKDVGIPTGFLPKYEDNGNRERLSMTELLKRNSCGISAVKFNQLLLQAGYLEEKERVSSNGSIKKYKALTEKGLQYGVNLISDKNQKETQPYYYSDRFMELFEEVAA